MADSSTSFTWRRVAWLFRPHRATVVLTLGLILVTSVLGVVNPLLIQQVFDRALFPADGSGPDVPLLVTLTAVMISVALVAGALGIWQTAITNRLGLQVLSDLRERLYGHLQQLSLSFFGAARTGDLQSRISSDVGGVQTAVTTTLSSILSNLVTFLSALVAMTLLSWQLTLLALATVPLFVLATRWVGRRREQLTGQAQEATAEMNVVTQETLSVSGITLARLFGRQRWEIDRFSRANRALADVTVRQQVIGQAFFTVIMTFLGLSPVIVYLVAGLLLEAGTASISAGTVVAFTTLQTRLFFPVARMLETLVELQSSRAMFRRVFTYLDVDSDVVEAPDAVHLDRATASGRVRFEGVHFTYRTPGTEETPALRGIDFTAEPGRLVAFVGASGAGKSTILNLVARLYDPTEGRITIDDVDLRELSLSSLAALVGFVTQESYLFGDTLRANIAYGHPEATNAEVEKAARAAAIHDRILELPEGYATVTGERGFRLSGGERQRVAIARVILHDPKILVLDEATSALDTASERRIQAALGELVSGRTTLAVAHRLSTVMAADVLHVVERGRIIESGTHEELLARGGAYQRLYLDQFGGGSIEAHCADGLVMSDGSWRPFSPAGRS